MYLLLTAAPLQRNYEEVKCSKNGWNYSVELDIHTFHNICYKVFTVSSAIQLGSMAKRTKQLSQKSWGFKKPLLLKHS